jgi:hypothetical protein
LVDNEVLKSALLGIQEKNDPNENEQQTKTDKPNPDLLVIIQNHRKSLYCSKAKYQREMIQA